MEIRFINQTDDKMAISRIYEESWKFAYKNIIPSAYLESIPEGHWVNSLDKPERFNLIMLDSNKIIGISSFCKSRFEDMENYGEIISIYFLPEYMGKGCGKFLLQATVDELVKMGFRDIFLWVLEDNTRARRFYEGFGFTPSGKYLNDNIGGKELREIQYVLHLD